MSISLDQARAALGLNLLPIVPGTKRPGAWPISRVVLWTLKPQPLRRGFGSRRQRVLPRTRMKTRNKDGVHRFCRWPPERKLRALSALPEVGRFSTKNVSSEHGDGQPERAATVAQFLN
jgi:hypothetical protein